MRALRMAVSPNRFTSHSPWKPGSRVWPVRSCCMAARLRSRFLAMRWSRPASVTNAHSGGISLNQMRFCTVHPVGSTLAGGGCACGQDIAGLADYQHRTWHAGRNGRVLAATWVVGTIAASAHPAKDAYLHAAGEGD